MIKVLFVCHGNICRSPMAEFVMKKYVKDAGLSDRFYIASCATSSEEIWGGRGNPIYPPAQSELRRQGIPFDRNKEAVQLRKSDYDKYDYLITMDSMNVRNATRIVGGDPQGKINKLMSYTKRGGDVADPWYSHQFDVAFRDIAEGCEALLAYILEHENLRA